MVTAASEDILEGTVKPVIVEFLRERGLQLSQEKTVITHILRGSIFWDNECASTARNC